MANKLLFGCHLKDYKVSPKVRMTRQGRFSDRAQTYLAFQSDFGSKLYEAFGKEPIIEPCIINFVVRLKHSRVLDVDNIYKAIGDALQYGNGNKGVIEDDCLIRGADKLRVYQGQDENSVYVELRAVDDKVSDMENIRAVINYLNNALTMCFGRKIGYKASTKTYQRHIRARFEEGFTLDDFKDVIEDRVADWGRKPSMQQYLRPQTLFCTKFEAYLNASKQGKGATDNGKKEPLPF